MFSKNAGLYEVLALLYCLFLVVMTCLFGMVGDNLLFKSDLFSLIHFFLGCSLFCFAPIAIVLGVILVPLSHHLRNRVVLVLVGAILGFSFFGFSFNFLSTSIGPFDDLAVYFSWFFGLLVFSLIFVPWFLNLQLSRPLLSISAQVAFPICIASFLFFALPNYWQRIAGTPAQKKNVVFLFLDGFAAHQLPVYNPQEEGSPKFNEFIDQALLFRNVYTNYTYTEHYFKTLYSGIKCGPPEGNIWQVLQKYGVNTRWSAYHPNTIPEVTITNPSYKGLRSNYLNHKVSKIPYLMGLDYNVYRFTGTRANDAPLVKLIYRALKHYEKQLFDMNQYFEDEVSRLRSENRPFFLLLSTNSFAESDWNLQLSKQRQVELWEDSSKLPENQRAMRDYVDNNDYTYRESDESVVENLAKINKIYQTNALINVIDSMLEFLKHKGWDKDTVVIVTCDHGKIFRNGKLNYGYHNDEDVTNVLMLAFNVGKSGVNEKLRETIDISKTILELFGIWETLAPNSISLFDDGDKEFISSLTLPSKVRSEWFMNLYFMDNNKNSILKVVKDLYNPQDMSLEQVVGFDTVPYPSGSPVPDYPIAKWVANAYKQYCLDPARIQSP